MINFSVARSKVKVARSTVKVTGGQNMSKRPILLHTGTNGA